MSVITVFVLALGLSFDTFAVSVSSGLLKRDILFAQALRIALLFAFFQAAMPIVGWLGGISIRPYIEPAGHWVALVLLGFIGVKMIADSFKPSCNRNIDPLRFRTCMLMALATSMDALAVGISFALVEVHLPTAILTIGVVTFLVAMLGILLGKKTGTFMGKPAEIMGGLILIAIGIKMVADYYVSSVSL